MKPLWNFTYFYLRDRNFYPSANLTAIMELFDFEERSKEELLSLFRAYNKAIGLNMIISITDSKGVIRHVNQKFCELSQYTRAELVGKTHSIVNSGYHSKEYFAGLWKTIIAGNMWRGDIRNKAKDGTCYWVDTVILPTLDEKGKVRQFMSFRLLINDRKQREADRNEYIKALEDMLYLTTHRVRRPISTTLGLIGLLDPELELGRDDLKQTLGFLRESALELDQLTRELTAFIYELEQKTRKG